MKKNKLFIIIVLTVILLLASFLAYKYIFTPAVNENTVCPDGNKPNLVGGSDWTCFPKGTKTVPL